MEDKSKREQTEFFIKNTLLVAGAAVAFCYGTEHLDKFNLEQTIKAKLIGDTDIQLSRYGAYDAGKREGKFCEVSASYQIKNIGEYPFVADWVEIELWEVPYIKGEELLDDRPTSYTLSERLKDGAKFPAQQVGETIKLDVSEQFGKQNILQRSFGYIVEVDRPGKNKPKSDSRYVIIGTAQAGLDEDGNGEADDFEGKPKKESENRPEIAFQKNDLKHISGTFNLCQSPPYNSP